MKLGSCCACLKWLRISGHEREINSFVVAIHPLGTSKLKVRKVLVASV
jgi:hypothetical protein